MPTTQEPPSEWLTADEAGLHLKMPPATVRALFNKRVLRASKVGRAWRTKRAWLDASIEKLESRPPRK